MAEEGQIRVKLGDFIVPVNPKSISVKFGKKVVKHDIPGRDGDIIQVLGTNSKEISFGGKFVTDVDKRSIELLREFEKKEVLDLVIPIRTSTASNSTKVVIQKLNISDEDGRNDYRDYEIDLVEWRAPEIATNQVVLVNQFDLDQLNYILRQRKQTQ